jgi:hypothetical protein
MIATLPSNGMMGIDYVDITIPKIADIRAMGNMPQSDELRKSLFVERLIGDKVWQITKYDRDYIFAIAGILCALNKMVAVVECECGSQFKVCYTLDDIKTNDLPTGIERCTKRNINGREFTFKTLTAKDEYDIELFALTSGGNYQEVVDDLRVGAVLGVKPSADCLQFVADLDMAMYGLAVDYYFSKPHGAYIRKECECPNCKKNVNATLKISSDLININPFTMVGNYANGLYKYIDFGSYMDLTFQEYDTMVNEINKRNNQ